MRKTGVSWKRFRSDGPWDAIVVGSGLGGLATAVMLAKHAGKRVLVLERHYTAGGYTHVFQRPGYEWDVGLHYVGDVQTSRSGTRRLFDHVTDGSLDWASMGEVYDRIVIGSDVYDFHAGAKAFAENLKPHFPGEERAIDEYVRLVREVAGHSRLFFADKLLPSLASATVGRAMRYPFLRWARRTTGEVLEGITKNPRLRAVLAAQYGDYGLPPHQSSFAMHAVLVRHFMWGGSYPVGGSSAIAASMAPLIEEAGGAIAVSAEVERILVEGGRAVGVRMADGQEVRAPIVVSDAGFHNTYLRLLPEDVSSRLGLRRQAETLQASASHLCVYLGMRRTDAELGLPKSNFWLYPHDDHDRAIAEYSRDPENAPPPLVYASFPSAKDPSFQERYPGRSTVELVTVAPWSAFSRWTGTRWHKRGEEYDALKSRLTEQMLERLYDVVPQVKGRIDHCETSTPLSTRHFAGYANGEIYGVAHDPVRFEQRFLRPQTPVPGLFLTGQDVVTCGIAGALAAGVMSASVVLDNRKLFLEAMRGATPGPRRTGTASVRPESGNAAGNGDSGTRSVGVR